VLMTFHITAILPAFGIALAAMTLVGNALGRGTSRTLPPGLELRGVTFVYGVVMSLPADPLAHPILGVFLTNPETRELAYLQWCCGADDQLRHRRMVLMNALIGAGDTRRSMWISLVCSGCSTCRWPGSPARCWLRPARGVDRQQRVPRGPGHQLRTTWPAANGRPSASESSNYTRVRLYSLCSPGETV